MVIGAIILAVGLPLAVAHGQLSPAEVDRLNAEAAAERAAAASASAAAEDGDIHALFFGDSVTFGTGRDGDSDPRAADVAAEALGWQATVSGHPGTGYAMASSSEEPFTTTFPAVATGQAWDVIVIQGSSNDADADVSREELASSIAEVVASARAQQPSAAIVLIGPYSIKGSGYDVERAVLAETAANLGLPFIDSVKRGWLANQPELIADEYHPNTAGHAVLGGSWADALREVLPPELVAGPAA